MSVLLLVVISLAVSVLQFGGHRFLSAAKQKIAVGYEIQYAIQHIYEHVLVGEGDISAPAVTLVSSNEFTLLYIDKNDIDGSPKTCRYRVTQDGALEFDKEDDGTFEESLGSKVEFIPGECAFTMDGNIFRIKLTAEFPIARAGETKERLALYSASYPRLASFR